MRRNTMLQINSKKLLDELNKRNLECSTTSELIGYDRGYLRKSMTGGYISRPATVLLRNMFGIEYESYGVISEESELAETPINEPEKVTIIDCNKLYEIIYKAVYNAVKNAWMDE